MTDLAAADREHCLRVVFAVEQALRDTLRPDKINVASLGNQVPHVHWHVIPRFADDAHFPTRCGRHGGATEWRISSTRASSRHGSRARSADRPRPGRQPTSGSRSPSS